MVDFIVIQDTREQIPWNFTLWKECRGQIKQKLDQGDYSIEGFEDEIRLERKRSSGEIYTNCFKYYKRFRKEMQGLSEIPISFILCEFSKDVLLRFPIDSGIPNKKVGTKYGRRYTWDMLGYSGLDVLNRLENIEKEFGVKTIFCDSREQAQDKAMEILMDFYNETK